MAKVLVLYDSAYGHIETMARAVAEGAREAGADVDVKRVPELVPEEVARHAGQSTTEEITGGAPYGATTIAGSTGSRLPTKNDLEGARYQGRRIAETARKLHG